MAIEAPQSGLTCVLYVSRTAEPFTRDALRGLAARAAYRNGPLGVSGVLLYSQGVFMQLLEGPPDTLLPLYERIAADPRHADVRRLVAGPIVQRMFAHWHMGLIHVGDYDANDRARLEAALDAIERTAQARGALRQVLGLLAEFPRLLPAPPAVA